MSAGGHLYSSCLKKRYYHNYDYAEQVALRRVEEEPGLELGVYACQYCGKFHLTKSPRQWGLEILGFKTIVDVTCDI